MAEFKRKKGEGFEAFLRRFKKGLKNSKRLMDARQNLYKTPKKSKRAQKEYALTSMQMRKKREYLRKTGKLTDEYDSKKSKRR